jgi:hypothetical protein
MNIHCKKGVLDYFSMSCIQWLSFVAEYFGKIGALAGSKMMMVLHKKTLR